MKQLTINASSRSQQGSASSGRSRREGKVPAVAYGKSKDPENLLLDAAELRQLLKDIGNSTPIVQLKGEKGGSRAAIIKEVQSHPINDKHLHVDFHEVGDDEKIVIAVPVHSIGEADGVKNEGGTLEFVSHSVHVRCVLKSAPEFVNVDVSALAVGDSIHVSQLPEIDGVEYMDHPEQPVFSVMK